MRTRIAALATTAILTLPALSGCFGGHSDKDCKTTSTAQAFAKPGGGSGGKGGGSKSGGSKGKTGTKTKPKTGGGNTGVNGGGGTTRTTSKCKKENDK